MKINCCGLPIAHVNIFDNQETDFAYNLYQCIKCGTLVREHVWEQSGVTVLPINTHETLTFQRGETLDLPSENWNGENDVM